MKSEGLNDILGQVFAENEKKSWNKTTEVFWAVGISRGKGLSARWFWRQFCEQCKKYPSGMTREHAKELAGIGGRVYKITCENERIQ